VGITQALMGITGSRRYQMLSPQVNASISDARGASGRHPTASYLGNAGCA
jgi:hypothetical protein